MTDTPMRILHIEVCTAQAALDAFAETWDRAERGEHITPIEVISFESLPELLSTLTPVRWELIRRMRRHGPLPAAELPALTGQSNQDAQADLAALRRLGIVEADADGRLQVPWDEIDLRVPLAA